MSDSFSPSDQPSSSSGEPSPTPDPAPQPDSQKDTATHILTGWWHDFTVALNFLTILPLKPKLPEGHDARSALRYGARAFPLAGLIVGAAGALAYGFCSLLALPPEAAAFIAIGAMTIFTGALHEDGLADLADGAGVRADRETRLRVMRDSRIGSFGTLALIIIVGVKAGCITAVGWPDHVATILLGSATASRAVLPALMRFIPPARNDGLAFHAGRPEENQVVLAALLGVAFALLFFGPIAGVVALLAGGFAAACIGWIAKRRIGGLTGDVLGAAQQVAEAAMMLAVVAFA